MSDMPAITVLGRKLDSIPFSPFHIAVILVLGLVGFVDGYDLALTAAVSGAVEVPVIASGGAGRLEHLTEALDAGADAVLCASILHYGQHTVGEIKAHLAAAGAAVRPTEL